MLTEAVDALEHKIRTVTKGMVTASDTLIKANVAVEKILDTLSRAPHPTHGTSSAAVLREQQVLARLAREFHVPETTLRSRLVGTTTWEAAQSDVDNARRSACGNRLQAKPVLDPWDRELFELLFVSHGRPRGNPANGRVDDLSK